MLRANIEGADAAIQAVVPSMRERSSGRIVSLSPGVRVDGLAGAGHNATDRGLPHRAGGSAALAPLAADVATEHAFVTTFLARWGEALRPPKGGRGPRR